jgi:hypothetical protein
MYGIGQSVRASPYQVAARLIRTELTRKINCFRNCKPDGPGPSIPTDYLQAIAERPWCQACRCRAATADATGASGLLNRLGTPPKREDIRKSQQ